MEFFGNTDGFLFFSAIVLGFLLGFYYEIFRFLRLAFPHPSWLVFLEDLGFFLPVTPILIFFHYALNDGIIRWFSLAGCIFGFCLYLGTVGKLFLRFSEGILFCIKKVLKGIFWVFFRPIGIVFKKITNCLYAKGKNIAIIIKMKQAKKRLLKEKRRLSRSAEKGFQ